MLGLLALAAIALVTALVTGGSLCGLAEVAARAVRNEALPDRQTVT